MASADLLSLLASGRRRSWTWPSLALFFALVLGAIAWWSRAGRIPLGHESVATVVSPSGPGPAAAPPVGKALASQSPKGEMLAVAKWLERIAADAGLGLLVGPGVSGRVAGFLPRSLPWRARLDALARVHGFSYRLADGVIEVVARQAEDAPERPAPQRPPPASAPAGAPTAPQRPPEPERRVRVLFPLHARAGELAREIGELLSSQGLSATSDAAANALILEGAPAPLERAGALVAELDLPRKRFLLEAQLIELSSTVRSELGVRWSVDGTLGGLVDFPGTTGEAEHGGIVVATTGAHALKARLNSLAADGRVRVVSRPRMIVVERQQAEIESVRILRIRLPERSAVVERGGGEAQVGRAVEEIPVGVSLRVEPSSVGGGRVAMHLAAKSSTLGRPQPPDLIPEELSRRFEADVIVASGETAVLGGLLREGRQDEHAGLPLLRSLPILGALFGRQTRQREGEELIVLITPSLLE